MNIIEALSTASEFYKYAYVNPGMIYQEKKISDIDECQAAVASVVDKISFKIELNIRIEFDSLPRKRKLSVDEKAEKKDERLVELRNLIINKKKLNDYLKQKSWVEIDKAVLQNLFPPGNFSVVVQPQLQITEKNVTVTFTPEQLLGISKTL